MERNDYTQQALKTWITEHPEEVQIAHACMTLVDEWNEFKHVYDDRNKYEHARLVDELGDVFYACAILQHLTSGTHLPEMEYANTYTFIVTKKVNEVHDLGTKILRSQHLEYYDREALDKKMNNAALLLGDCLCGLAITLGISIDSVLANNIRKLTDRHG